MSSAVCNCIAGEIAVPPLPESKLTPTQFEIMEIVWVSEDGATVAEIWEQVSASREVGRTTILNLVGRLEQRHWLKRRKTKGAFRYLATIDRDTVTADVADQFVNDFFGGSASDLVMSLLGSKKVSKAEIKQLRLLLEHQTFPKDKRKGK